MFEIGRILLSIFSLEPMLRGIFGYTKYLCFHDATGKAEA